MNPKKYTVYWDACIFIALIANEQRPNREMDGVWDCIENVLNGKTQIITLRDIFFEEVWPKSHMEVDALRNLMKRRNIQLPSKDIRIEKIAADLRNHYDVLGPKKLGENDSLHLATAIHYKADAFYTFDDGKRRKNTLGLLGLNGNVVNYPLVICKPPIKQYKFDFLLNYPTKK